MSRARTWGGAAAVALAATACTARGPARSATNGVLDALDAPDASHPLVRDVHGLVSAYVAEAKQRGPAKAPGEAARELAGAFVAGATEGATENEAAVRALVEDVTRSALRAALDEMTGRPPRAAAPEPRPATGAPPTRIASGAAAAPAAAIPQPAATAAERAGAEMVRGATAAFLSELEARLGPDADGRLGDALAGAAARTSSAIVRGAAGELGPPLGACARGDAACGSDLLVRRLSRAAAAGATEGFGARVEPWPAVLAGGAGALLGAAVAWAMARRRDRAPLR